MASPRAPTTARPKRAGDDFTRTHHLDSGEASTKKPRFDYRNPSTLAPDAAEADAELDLDVVGKTGQMKRNAVNIDGYESDSSADNAEVRASAKAAKAAEAAAADDDDDDMFASSDEDKDTAAHSKPKQPKQPMFLNRADMEGEEEDSKGGGHVSLATGAEHGSGGTSSESESGAEAESVDSEVGEGGKKKHAPKLDAFNVKNEVEDGLFDATGHFIRKAADPLAVHDTWLDGVSKNEMRRAKEAQGKRYAQQRARDRADDAVDLSELLSTLIARLEKGETVLEALQRLGGGARRKPKWAKRKGKTRAGGGEAMDIDDDEGDEEGERQRKAAVEQVTEAADGLLSRGHSDIYDSSRELLQRHFGRETGADWRAADEGRAGEADGAGASLWEYRWAGGDTHGPFDGATMAGWRDAGYFGDGVEFRRIGGAWRTTAEFGA